MSKTILITGSTDGIGLEAAKLLAADGHHMILHGRNPAKLEAAQTTVGEHTEGATTPLGYTVDLSNLDDVKSWADELADNHPAMDVVINNAGVFQTPNTQTSDGLDVRFAVNTIAPYLITRRLAPILGPGGRVVNLSSAAQAPVDLEAMVRYTGLDNMAAYAQSKLALTMWSMELGLASDDAGPVVVAVNPGSLLATKMVREGFGVAGSDIGIGADIIARAAVGDDFEQSSGRYFDNDAEAFAPPHPDAEDATKRRAVIDAIEALLS